MRQIITIAIWIALSAGAIWAARWIGNRGFPFGPYEAPTRRLVQEMVKPECLR
jgi:hypothetical protein